MVGSNMQRRVPLRYVLLVVTCIDDCKNEFYVYYKHFHFHVC